MKSIIFEYFDITYFIIYYNMKKKNTNGKKMVESIHCMDFF